METLSISGWTYYRPVFPTLWDDMHEVNGFFLFDLGAVIALSMLPYDTDLRAFLTPYISPSEKALREFAETPENQRDVPEAAASAAFLANELKKLIAKNPYPSFTQAEKETFVWNLAQFRDRLQMNLGKVYSFVFDEKGGRSVKTLWRDALALVDDTARPHLSDFVSENIQEAAKSWVVDRPTAVGFHMMRSVECVLREYKTLVTGQGHAFIDKRGTTQYQGFGTLISDLDKRLEDLKKNKQSFGRLELVIGMLRPLGKLYRHPLSHPELIKLSESDARLAFETGINSINTMVQDAVDGGSHFTKPFSGGKL